MLVMITECCLLKFISNNPCNFRNGLEFLFLIKLYNPRWVLACSSIPCQYFLSKTLFFQSSTPTIFRSPRTLSHHLSLGLPFGLFNNVDYLPSYSMFFHYLCMPEPSRSLRFYLSYNILLSNYPIQFLIIS
jgi:hypothetical protein